MDRWPPRWCAASRQRDGGRIHMQRVLVTGAGGFIGHHLVKRLVARGCWVRGVDLKKPEYEPSPAHEFELLDLRRWDDCVQATRGVEEVYNLAANMGGIGFIESHKAEIMHDNVLINVHMLEAARLNEVKRYLYTSSACVYPAYRQNSADVTALKEEDAYPADPEDGYGWEKLFSERQCRHYYEDYGLETRVVRFHNIFGPLGTYDGGREKSPAAICRKIALANDGDEIEVGGDGQHTPAYCYIDDCVVGIGKLMRSDYHEPLNLGQDRLITANELVATESAIAGNHRSNRSKLNAPQGGRGGNSGNSRLRAVLQWEPQTSLQDGLGRTYRWICSRLGLSGALGRKLKAAS